MSHAVQAQKKWSSTQNWLRNCRLQMLNYHPTAMHYISYVDVAENLLLRLAWDTPMDVYGCGFHGITTLKLTEFLSNDCLTDALIDPVIQYMSNQLKSYENLSKTYLLSTLAFTQIINTARSKDAFKGQSRPLLRAYEALLLGSDAPYILTGPVFIPLRDDQNGVGHWAAFKVNFNTREISYGVCCF